MATVAVAQNDITLADLYRYLAAHEEALVAERKAREESSREFDRRLGELTNRLGDVVEHLFVPEAVMEQFIALGYTISETARDVKLQDENKKTVAEIDILLKNGLAVILVEIKTNLREKHIDEFMAKLARVRAGKQYSEKQLLGAVAGAVVSDSVKAYARNHGLYVIEQTGNTIQIVPEDAGWQPQVW
ncbi:MAG: hypothetical protein Ta2A_11730 [Treponemataceae bacterium]|nr:MAG: hypothetical protein Ta2A_11730 [Treponemataceae bacterium]